MKQAAHEPSPQRPARALQDAERKLAARPPTAAPERPAGSCPCGGGCPRCAPAAGASIRIGSPDDAAEHRARRDAGIATPSGRRVAAASPAWAPASVHATLSDQGRPLEAATRARMELRLGAGFGNVRVHTDDGAARSAREVGARAYAVGQDLVFGAGAYAPGTPAGDALLAHELAHAAHEPGNASVLRRQEAEEEEEVAPVPAWALSTPTDALPGEPVPGYDTPRDTYSEVDRSAMLTALNRRVQVNGRRLADFYSDLRLAWSDLVIDLASDDAGLALSTQTIAGILSTLLTAPLGPVAGTVVGILADALVNVTDDVISERETEARRRRLRELLVAPEVSDVGQRGANARLAGLLLDAVGYATWLQVATLDDLGRFRIPPEFPRVPEAEIRAEIATAIIAYQAPAGMRRPVAEAWDPSGVFYDHLIEHVADDVLHVGISEGRETDIRWHLPTQPALRRAVLGRRIGDLHGVPVVVQFEGSRHTGGYVWDLDDRGPPRVVFAREADGTILLRGNFLGLYELHLYAHPGHPPPTYDDIHGPYPRSRSPEQVEAAHQALKAHYTELALQGAGELFRDYIDPFTLPAPGSATR